MENGIEPGGPKSFTCPYLEIFRANFTEDLKDSILSRLICVAGKVLFKSYYIWLHSACDLFLPFYFCL